MLMPMPRKTGTRRIEVRCAAIANHLVEFEVKVSGHDLEARERFIDVVVGVGQDRLLGCVRSVGAEVVVHRHVLQGAGRSVVERIVFDLLACCVDAPLPHFV